MGGAEDQPTRGFSRRALLKGGLATLALVGLSGIAIAGRGTKLVPLPADGLRVFTAEEYAILTAIADRVCPEPSATVPGPRAIDVARLADRLFEHAEADVQGGLKLALAIFESGLTGAVFFERITPFSALSPADQDRTLLAFRDSKVPLRRTLFRALSALTASLYYGDPRTFASVGYPGPPDPAAMRTAYAGQLVDLEALRAGAGTKKGG